MIRRIINSPLFRTLNPAAQQGAAGQVANRAAAHKPVAGQPSYVGVQPAQKVLQQRAAPSTQVAMNQPAVSGVPGGASGAPNANANAAWIGGLAGLTGGAAIWTLVGDQKKLAQPEKFEQSTLQEGDPVGGASLIGSDLGSIRQNGVQLSWMLGHAAGVPLDSDTLLKTAVQRPAEDAKLEERKSHLPFDARQASQIFVAQLPMIYAAAGMPFSDVHVMDEHGQFRPVRDGAADYENAVRQGLTVRALVNVPQLQTQIADGKTLQLPGQAKFPIEVTFPVDEQGIMGANVRTLENHPYRADLDFRILPEESGGSTLRETIKEETNGPLGQLMELAQDSVEIDDLSLRDYTWKGFHGEALRIVRENMRDDDVA